MKNNLTEKDREEIAKAKEEIKQHYIKQIEERVRYWQGKDFPTWEIWYERLKRMDPKNPLLKKPFRKGEVK